MDYDIVKDYAMKCRLYPTPTQKQAIDNALTAIRVFHNCLVYDMWNNGVNLREGPAKGKNKEAETVHYPDFKSALSAEYKNHLIEAHPIIRACPQAALSTNVGLKEDLKKEFNIKKPIECQKPRYYTERHPRRSYSYQETLSKLKIGENPKVFRFNLCSIGPVKVRGWNQHLRFDNEDTDFLTWASHNPKDKITVIVTKDAVGDYFIIFKIKRCMKPFPPPCNEAKVGVDVGVRDIAICSNGKKYENKKFKKAKKKHQRRLNRELSRRWGPSNEQYREARKKNRAEQKKFLENPELYSELEVPLPIRPSKRYLRTKIQHAKLNRKISRKRELWNHEISKELVANSGAIAIETLSVKGMMRNKYLSYALSDAAFSTLLHDIEYKVKWHHRTLLTIDRWTPSSKKCSVCGYLYKQDQYHLKPWSLSIREWTCPVCGTKHDRDINAAVNILFYAEEQKAKNNED